MIMIFGTLVENDDISSCFLHFFDIFIFWAVRGVKGLKIIQNQKQQLYPTHTIAQEESWFLVHLCKMMISPGAFFQFCEIFIFGAVRGVKGQNMTKDDKKSVCCSWYLRSHISYDCHLWYTCVNDNISRNFFHFFKIWFSGLLEG